MLYSKSSKEQAEIAMDKILTDLKQNWVGHCPSTSKGEVCLQTAIDKHTESNFVVKTSIQEEIEKVIVMPIPLYNDTHTKSECIKLMTMVKELIL